MCLYIFAHWHIHLLAIFVFLDSGIQKTLHARRTERSGGMV